MRTFIKRFLVGFIVLLSSVFIFNPANAVVVTPVGNATCTSPTTSCTINLTAPVPSGSFVVFVAASNTSVVGTPAIFDNATIPNCGGAYSQTKSSNVNGSLLVGVCPSTTSDMSSGSTGCSGTCGIGISYPTSYSWTISAYIVSGINAYDKAGAAVVNTWTSGSPTAFSTSAVPGYSSDWQLGIIAVGNGASADTVGTYTGGWTALDTITSATNKPELFLSTNSITSGTNTVSATPTSSAGRSYNALTINFSIIGAARLGCVGLLLGAGC